MKSSILSIIVATAFLAFSSCKKSNVPAPVEPGNPAPLLAVKLGQDYLSQTAVDSAVAEWTSNGITQRIALLQRNDSLIADINSFQEGTGQLNIIVYSNIKFYNQYKLLWLLSKATTLSHSSRLGFDGPHSFFDAAWFPRATILDGLTHKAIVALRPEDPFFEVKDPGHAVVKLIVERGYWKKSGAVFAGGGVWECNTGCSSVIDNEYFKFIPSRIGQKPWDHISINILFQTQPWGEGWGLSLEQDI